MASAQKLFAPLQRLHTAGDFHGTGIVGKEAQRIVHRHGGKMWAEARLGKAATFFFTVGMQTDTELISSDDRRRDENGPEADSAS